MNSRSFGSAAPEGGIGVTMLVPLLDLLCAFPPAAHISRPLVAHAPMSFEAALHISSWPLRPALTLSAWAPLRALCPATLWLGGARSAAPVRATQHVRRAEQGCMHLAWLHRVQVLTRACSKVPRFDRNHGGTEHLAPLPGHIQRTSVR